jgi:hypothetical protein
MNWQKRLGGTVSGRMGLPIIDGPHPYFRKARKAEEEPILLTERKPSRAPPPPPSARRREATVELDLGDEGVEIFEDTRPGLPASGVPRPPMMAPPPKRERPASLPPKSAPAAPQEAQSEPPRPSPESVAFSLPELIAAATGKKTPAPAAEPEERDRESSVSRSLAELLEIEQQRVAEDAAAKQKEAAEAARLSALAPKVAPVQPRPQESSVELSLQRVQEVEEERIADEAAAKEDEAREGESLERNLRKLVEEGLQGSGQGDAAEAGESLLSTYGQPEGEESPAQAGPGTAAPQSVPFVFLDPEIIEPEETSISIELVFGLPWEDKHAEYRLSGREQEACEKDFPEKETKWVLPVPRRDSLEKGDIGILAQFAKETRREFNGREYYVVDAPFAGAKRVARTGCLLHIWPESSTDYEFLGEVSGGIDLSQPQTGEWSISTKTRFLTEEELFKYSALLPEGKPVFIHPVPEDKGQTELESSIMQSLNGGRIPRMTLGKKEYFVMEIGTVAEWQEITFMYPNVRIASRKGEWLGIWPGSETGHEMMDSDYGFEAAFHGPKGPPLLETGAVITPRESERAAIKRLYGKSGEKRWLYPLAEKMSLMDSDTLNFLTVVSCREIELTGISPLISLDGNFYVSLKYQHPEAQASSLENEAVRVHPRQGKIRDALSDIRQKAAERKEARTKPMIVLPPDPEQRKPLLDMFPEGKTRYLYFVDAKNTGYVALKPHVALMRGKEKEVYLVLNEPYEGSIAVSRQGVAIYPLE